MEWYLKCLRHYADFRGRARRKEYWMFFLFMYLIGCILGMGDAYLMKIFDCPPLIFLLYFSAMFIPMLAVTVRRLHDINKSGWFLFIVLIPCIGGIILLIWCCTDSFQNENEWGKNPKEN